MRFLSRGLGLSFLAGTMVGVVGTVGAATLRGSDIFPDVPASSYYDAAVGEMYAIGVIKGNPNGTFNPGGLVTRADVAVMLQRLRDELQGTVVSSRSSSSRSSSASSVASSASSSSSSTSSLNPKGTVRFTTAELRVPENVSTKKITVAIVRTGGNEGSVTVDYSMTAGTATEGSDYTKAAGTLVFANKETSKTFDITIKDDSSNEGNETATITLSNPGSGVSIGTPSSATLIITDDEAGSSSSSSSTSSASSSTGPTVGFSAAQYSVDEDMTSLTVTVMRFGTTTGTAAVNYATANGSAKAGSEYTQTSGTLSFAANETSKTFTVGIANDTAADGAKSFTLTLTSPTGATIKTDGGSATVTINDDETVTFGSGSFKFSRSAYATEETAGSVTVTVQRTGGSLFAAGVNYATSTITASGGSDFTHTSGTLTFAPGEAAKTITIPILKDSIADSGETFSVDLTNPTNGTTLIDPYTTTVTID